MPTPDHHHVIGWDIGGAHVKACLLQNGQVLDVAQWGCPLWQGLDHLTRALQAAEVRWPGLGAAQHAVTMRERGGDAGSGASSSSAASAAPRGSILTASGGGSPFVVIVCEPAGSIGWRDFDVKLVEFSVQGVTADIERLGDVAHVPAMLLEHLQQHLPLVGLDRVELLDGGCRIGRRRFRGGIGRFGHCRMTVCATRSPCFRTMCESGKAPRQAR